MKLIQTLPSLNFLDNNKITPKERLTSSDTSKVRLSANPNIESPKVSKIPLLVRGEKEFKTIKKN